MNPVKNEVIITLKGVDYTLRADIECLVGIEADCKRGLFAIMEDISSLRLNDIVAVIVRGLKAAGDDRLSKADVESIILEMGMSRVFMALAPFFNRVMYGASLGKPEEATAKS